MICWEEVLECLVFVICCVFVVGVVVVDDGEVGLLGIFCLGVVELEDVGVGGVIEVGECEVLCGSYCGENSGVVVGLVYEFYVVVLSVICVGF